MARKLVCLAATALVGAIALMAGCSKPVTPRNSNRPPVVRVFLTSAPDTLTYRTRMYWSGNDPDGDVKGFELQLLPGESTPPGDSWDFTTRTDSIFTLPVGNGVETFTFWVRAVDNQDLRSAPQSLVIHLRNHKPTVSFYNLPHRSQGGGYHFLPVLTLQWTGTDPEGQKTIARYHLWLDPAGGTAPSFDTTLAQADTVFTLRMEHFGEISTTRTRTVYLAAADEAHATSDTVRYSWTVDAVDPGSPRVLLVDEYNVDPKVTNNTSPMDSLYRRELGTVTSGNYTVLDLFDVDGFRFTRDADELLRHFDAVVWYNEGTVFPQTFDQNRRAITGLLDRGGRLFVSTITLFDQAAADTGSFNRYYFGIRQRYCPLTGDCNYVIRPTQILRSRAGSDSLAVGSGFQGGVDFFLPADSTVAEFYLPYTDSRDDTTAAGYIKGDHAAVLNKTTASGGRVILSTIPLNRMNKFGNRDGAVRALLRKVVFNPPLGPGFRRDP